MPSWPYAFVFLAAVFLLVAIMLLFADAEVPGGVLGRSARRLKRRLTPR